MSLNTQIQRTFSDSIVDDSLITWLEAFMGALLGKTSNKGTFITTSDFTESARKSVIDSKL